MSMFPSHRRDPTYWPGGSICVSAPIWRHKTADPSKLQIISSSLQSATIRNTSSPPDPWDTFTIYSPHINACKLIYSLCS